MTGRFGGLTKRLTATAVAGLLALAGSGTASAQDYGESIKVERLVFDVTVERASTSRGGTPGSCSP